MRSVTGCRFLAAGCLAVFTVTGCGNPSPGAHTPTLPPAPLWRAYSEAGHKAFEQGRYAEAEAMFLAALKEAEQLKRPDPENPRSKTLEDPSLPASLSDLADVYVAQGRYAEAEPLYQRAQDVASKLVGPDDAFIGRTLNRLASLYQAQGKVAEAEPLFKRALAINERAMGWNHPTVATSLHHLGELSAAQGKAAEAELLYKRALAIREALLGPDHLDVAESLDGLALFYFAQGNLIQAKQLHKRSVAIKVKALGPEHPKVVASLEQFAALLRKAEGTDGKGGIANGATGPMP